MTADERIERLLNRFGQTMADLPKVEDNDWSGPAYESKHLIIAKKAALAFQMEEWHDADILPEIRYEVEDYLLDYICHLADVIDKMEIALETAANNAGCDFCAKSWEECKKQPNNQEFVCDFQLDDEWLY